MLPLYWSQGGQSLAFLQVVLQQQRPAVVPWEYEAGRVRTKMLQKNALKIYLMAHNLGRAHTPPKGARALCPQK